MVRTPGRTNKKKTESELNSYFPGKYESAKTKEFYSRLKTYIMTVCDAILKEDDRHAEIKKFEDDLAIFANPVIFAGKESAEIRLTKSFEDACHHIAKITGRNAKEMTVYEFLNTINQNGRQSHKSKRPVR